MKALVLTQYNRLEIQDVADPVPGANEVRVAVKACGICGSDVHGMDGSTGRRRPPIIMGHEAAGVIESVGPAVGEWKPGDRVTFDSTIYCGSCHYCRAGQVNLCDRRRVLGVSCEDYRQHGAFADFVVVPERVLYRVPEEVSFEHAALVEPFSIALHAISRAPAQLNDAVMVVGAGMIGLALTQALATTGCGHLIVVDVADDRLAMAQESGATQVVNSKQEDASEIARRVTHGRGADVVYEAVGLPETVDLSVRSARKGGSVVLVGNVSPKVDLPLQVVVTRELAVFGSCASRGDYPACLDLMASRALRPESLLSATAPLDQGADWFTRLHRREPGLMKVILRP